MLAKWFKTRTKNWGDHINPIFIEMLCDKIPIWANEMKDVDETVYLCVGSILHWADKDTVVWGAGFITPERRLKENPKKIVMVRGPLSRSIVMKQGYACPEFYGDPILLLSKLHKPSVEKKYKYGFIPHYIDRDKPVVEHFRNKPGVKVIDIQGSSFKVINDVLECENIFSSSLHGLVMAESYGIPNLWVKLGDDLLGGDFKFQDYYLAVRGKEVPPFILDTTKRLMDLKFTIGCDIDLDKMLDSCPFRRQT